MPALGATHETSRPGSVGDIWLHDLDVAIKLLSGPDSDKHVPDLEPLAQCLTSVPIWSLVRIREACIRKLNVLVSGKAYGVSW